MGWSADDVFRATLNHQQMTILDASNELHPFAALSFINGLGEVLIQVFYQHIGIFCLQITTVMRDNLSISQCDDITADGKVIICHLIAY